MQVISYRLPSGGTESNERERMSCAMGPVYMRVDHPNGENYTVFDDEVVLEAAINRGLIDPAWKQELVFLPQGSPDVFRARAWHYITKGLAVPAYLNVDADAGIQ